MISVIMGSISDLEVMQPTCDFLDKLKIKFEKKILSAHRTPHEMYNYAETAKQNGIKVIVAGAGGAAHVPGMIAALSNVPVIGVPIWSKDFNGNDALLSMVQMPSGIPVATVGINRSLNAAILAAEILAIEDNELYKKLQDYKAEMRNKVTAAQI